MEIEVSLQGETYVTSRQIGLFMPGKAGCSYCRGQWGNEGATDAVSYSGLAKLPYRQNLNVTLGCLLG